MKILFKCESKSYLDGRSFAFGDVAEVADEDARTLLKTGEAVETSLPVTVDAKGNELASVSMAAHKTAGAAAEAALDGSSARAASSNQKRR